MLKNVQQEGEGVVQGNAKVLGFGGLALAKHTEGSKGLCVDLTINQVSCVLWLIYKMSKLLDKGSLYTES